MKCTPQRKGGFPLAVMEATLGKQKQAPSYSLHPESRVQPLVLSAPVLQVGTLAQGRDILGPASQLANAGPRSKRAMQTQTPQYFLQPAPSSGLQALLVP